MAQLKLYLFGAPRVVLDDKPVAIPRRKVLAALIYLALTRKRVERDTLAELLWPESDRKAARSSLRRELHALNQAIGPGWLDVTRDDIAFASDADLWTDVEAFREHQAAAVDAVNTLQSLQQAATLYQNDFLTGFTLSDCPAFDDWQFFESEGLRADFADLLSQLVAATKAQSDYTDSLNYARRWLTLDNLDESIHRHLMELYALAGQHAAAIRQYEECVRVLDEELGVPPEEETVELFELIQARKLVPPAHASPAPASLEPVSPAPASQVSASPAPASPNPAVAEQPATSHQPSAVNLPSLSTSFVGREDELDAIVDLLTNEADCRMVTLVGPGGIGKTRLAVAAAQRLISSGLKSGSGDGSPNRNPKSSNPPPNYSEPQPFPDGIYFVSLATTRTDESILPSIVDALDIASGNGRDPKAELLRTLKPKSLLLILDNFEHVQEQADLLLDILLQVPKITLLITSRVSINLQQEWVYAVGGFPLPSANNDDAQRLADNNAVKLFVQRARRADSSISLSDDAYQQIAKVCRLVDGLPLGIELAASWVRVLGIDEIAHEIESSLDFLATTKHTVLDRHSSMRTVLEQTWQLLSPTEQEVFCKLSIFQSGFTRQAANRIADASIMTLAGLVRKSIISHGQEGRYTIHGLLHQFAAAKLNELNESVDLAHTINEKHSRYFGSFLQTLEAELSGSDSAAALTQIGQDLNNIRSGWRWAVAHLQQSPMLARLADGYVEGLFYFYDTRSRFREGAAEFQIGYDHLVATGVAPSATQSLSQLSDMDVDLILLLGRVSARLGWFAFQSGQPEEAKALLLASLDCHRQLEKQSEIIFSLNYLGAVYRHLGAYTEAAAALEESQHLCRDTNNQFGLTVALNILGQIAYEQRAYVAAQAYLEESLSVKQAIGDQRGTTFSLLYLGLVAAAQDNFTKAIRLFRESKNISESYGDRRGIAIALSNLADAEKAMGNLPDARLLYEESLVIYSEIDNVIGMVTTYIKLGDLALAQDDTTTTEEWYTQALEAADSLRLPDEQRESLVATPRAWLKAKAA